MSMINKKLVQVFIIYSAVILVACDNSEKYAQNAFTSIEAKFDSTVIWDFSGTRPALFINDIDARMSAINSIEAQLNGIITEYPETAIASNLKKSKEYGTGLFSKIERYKRYLRHEKALFNRRKQILNTDQNGKSHEAFGFDFFNKPNTECDTEIPENINLTGFRPELEHRDFQHFFLKFEKIVDLLILVEEQMTDASNSQDTDVIEKLGLSNWASIKEKSAQTYKYMFKNYLEGRIPMFIRDQSNRLADDPTVKEFLNLSNVSLIRCNSVDHQKEFESRIGKWLPKYQSYYLDIVGDLSEKLPIYMTLHSYASKSDKNKITKPLNKGLTRKYGDPLFESFNVDFNQSGWITDDGMMIVSKFAGDKDPLSDLARFSLTYIYLPKFIEKYEKYIRSFLDSFSMVSKEISKKDKYQKDQINREIEKKL